MNQLRKIEGRSPEPFNLTIRITEDADPEQLRVLEACEENRDTIIQVLRNNKYNIVAAVIEPYGSGRDDPSVPRASCAMRFADNYVKTLPPMRQITQEIEDRLAHEGYPGCALQPLKMDPPDRGPEGPAEEKPVEPPAGTHRRVRTDAVKTR